MGELKRYETDTGLLATIIFFRCSRVRIAVSDLGAGNFVGN